METKICSKCKEEKDVCEFGNRSNSKDGKSSNCKKCHNLRSADYQKRNYKECLENCIRDFEKQELYEKCVEIKNTIKLL
jgi:hypothetical protein